VIRVDEKELPPDSRESTLSCLLRTSINLPLVRKVKPLAVLELPGYGWDSPSTGMEDPEYSFGLELPMKG
jgi:hypothetical protein